MHQFTMSTRSESTLVSGRPVGVRRHDDPKPASATICFTSTMMRSGGQPSLLVASTYASTRSRNLAYSAGLSGNLISPREVPNCAANDETSPSDGPDIAIRDWHMSFQRLCSRVCDPGEESRWGGEVSTGRANEHYCRLSTKHETRGVLPCTTAGKARWSS